MVVGGSIGKIWSSKTGLSRAEISPDLPPPPQGLRFKWFFPAEGHHLPGGRGPDLLLSGVKAWGRTKCGIYATLIPPRGSRCGKFGPQSISRPVDEGLGFGSPFPSRVLVFCVCVFLLGSIALHLLILAAPLTEPGGVCFPR